MAVTGNNEPEGATRRWKPSAQDQNQAIYPSRLIQDTRRRRAQGKQKNREKEEVKPPSGEPMGPAVRRDAEKAEQMGCCRETKAKAKPAAQGRQSQSAKHKGHASKDDRQGKGKGSAGATRTPR